MQKRRRCYYCRRLYYPNPRCHNPKACSKCQQKRKYDYHKQWREDDPEVMEDRRKATRAWFAERPGHLKRYRALHPEYVERNRQKQRERRSKKRPVDISISILAQHIDLYKEYARSPPR